MEEPISDEDMEVDDDDGDDDGDEDWNDLDDGATVTSKSSILYRCFYSDIIFNEECLLSLLQ